MQGKGPHPIKGMVIILGQGPGDPHSPLCSLEGISLSLEIGVAVGEVEGECLPKTWLVFPCMPFRQTAKEPVALFRFPQRLF